MSKVLVLYYSLEGNTKRVAEYIATELEAQIEALEPIKDIKPNGFKKFLWGGRQVVMKEKPELKPLAINIEDYDVILVGSPVWAGTFAPAIRSFLEEFQLNHKKIACFFTHQGGMGKADLKFKEALGEKNQYLGAIDFINVNATGDAFISKCKTWIDSLDI